MTAEKTKITVENLVQTLDRIEQWIQALRKGIEALPQDQVIEVEDFRPPEVKKPDRVLC